MGAFNYALKPSTYAFWGEFMRRDRMLISAILISAALHTHAIADEWRFCTVGIQIDAEGLVAVSAPFDSGARRNYLAELPSFLQDVDRMADSVQRKCSPAYPDEISATEARDRFMREMRAKGYPATNERWLPSIVDQPRPDTGPPARGNPASRTVSSGGLIVEDHTAEIEARRAAEQEAERKRAEERVARQARLAKLQAEAEADAAAARENLKRIQEQDCGKPTPGVLGSCRR